MINFYSIDEMIGEAEKSGVSISALVLEAQAVQTGQPKNDILREMAQNLQVMKAAIVKGINSQEKSASGLSGGSAYKLQQAVAGGKTLGGNQLDKALMNALAVAEVNACMGRIVAAPTAGSCGIMPATLISVMEERQIPEENTVLALFTAAGIGAVIAHKATLAGAEGGCQAECGSASAMAAGALVEMAGGSPRQVGHAAAIALKNVLGLVCDPVAGLVEAPCIKRNALGAANALVAADLALAGIESIIPVDEVIEAMKKVGDLMTPALKETAMGGLADTPTGRRLAEEIFANQCNI